MREAAIGSVVGGVRLDAEIGRGGMGVVYRGHQEALNRQVAVKVVLGSLSDDEEFRRRFRRECEIAASLEHPNVVPIYSADAQDGQLSVTMRFIDGIDLGQLIRQDGPLAPLEVAEVIAQVASALDAAHRRDLIHRDVKPANILISAVEGRTHVYLTDFGLSRTTADPHGLTGTGILMGTPAYMAPEQYQGTHLDQRIDVYALGCVLFHSLTGRTPFPGDSAPAIMWAHVVEPPPSPRSVVPTLPAELDTVINRGLAKNPDDRYASAGELARAFQGVLGGSGAGAWAALPPADSTAVNGRGAGFPSPTSAWTGAGTGTAAERPVGSTGGSTGDEATGPIPRPLTGAVGPPPPLAKRKSPSSRPRRPRWLTIGLPVAVVLVAAAVVAVLVLHPWATVGTVVGAPIAVGRTPVDIESGGGFVWTADAGDGSVTKIDPRTGVGQRIIVGGTPSEIVVDQGAVWIANFSDTITRLDIANGQAARIATDPGAPITHIAAGDGMLWISHRTTNTVSRIDMGLRRLAPGAPIAVGRAPSALLYLDHRLYVSNTDDRSLSVLDRTGKVLGNPVLFSRDIGGMEADGGTIYIVAGDVNAPADQQEATVLPVDTRSYVVGDPISLGRASWFDVGAGAGWASYPLTSDVRRIDFREGGPSGNPIKEVGRSVGAMQVLDGELWIANRENNTVIRVRLEPSPVTP